MQSDDGARPTIPSEASAQVIRETRLFGDSAPLMSVQKEFGIAPVILDPGTYEIDALGTPLTLRLPTHWRLDYEAPGVIWLTRPGAELEALLPAVGFHRPIGFVDPTLAGFAGNVKWTMQDLGEWIDAVPQVVVLESGTIDIGDRTGRWWDVDVDPTLGPTIQGCDPGSCVKLMKSGLQGQSVARDLERIRWYEIPDPLGPIIVFVSTDDDDFTEFASETDELLRNAIVGPSQPNPVRVDVAHTKSAIVGSNVPTMVSGLEGVVIEAPFFLDIIQRPGEISAWRIGWRDLSDRVALVRPATTLEGEPIESTDDIVAAIEANGVVLSRSSGEMMGMPATIIDFDIDSDGVLLVSPRRSGFSTSQADWPNLSSVRAWVIDSPIGPAIISASGEDEENFDRAIDRVDWFTELISFCEPTDSCGGER